MATVAAYIALGSNLDDPLQHVRTAVDDINSLPQTTLTRLSQWYLSQPLGPPGQPEYVNGVVEVHTSLSPTLLLASLQSIEDHHQRRRKERWGARTLDLDILLYGDRSIDTPELQIPHPELSRRNFVLLPLAEIAPLLRLPDGRDLRDLLANVGTQGIVRITEGD